MATGTKPADSCDLFPEPTLSDLQPQDDRDLWRDEREAVMRPGIDWPTALWIGLLHVGALAAPFTFTWQGLCLMLFLGWLTGSIGICLGFHRLLTHRSFKTFGPLRFLIAVIGGLAGEGSAIYWAANHRKHHALSDQIGDPHSPHDGPWWSHMLWVFWRRDKPEYDAYNRRWAPDLADEKSLQFLDKTFIVWHLLLSAVLLGIGYRLGGGSMAASFVIWGMFVRLVYVLHATWLINSATHMWGYRTYDTTDDSRNNWWVALLTYGEGWHNNHHAFPAMARAGHQWWEIDMTFWVIRLMQRLGLVWGIVDGQHRRK